MTVALSTISLAAVGTSWSSFSPFSGCICASDITLGIIAERSPRTEAKFKARIRGGTPVYKFPVDGDYTFANERLARHYGIPDIAGSQFRRVDGSVRTGVGRVP